MTNKQALRKLLERVIANSGMTWYSEEQLGSEDCFDFPEADANLIAALGPKDVLALLDELEAAEKRIAELEAREVKLPDVEKWRSPEAVRAQNAYRLLVGQEVSAAGIITKVGK